MFKLWLKLSIHKWSNSIFWLNGPHNFYTHRQNKVNIWALFHINCIHVSLLFLMSMLRAGNSLYSCSGRRHETRSGKSKDRRGGSFSIFSNSFYSLKNSTNTIIFQFHYNISLEISSPSLSDLNIVVLKNCFPS